MSCRATTRSAGGSAESAGLHVRRADWILEGGAIDVDGTGLAVTTEQCLLNPNRNPFLSRADVEARLRADLGIDRVLWLGSGLMNDHTDGHVDNLARFVGAGRIAIPEPARARPQRRGLSRRREPRPPLRARRRARPLARPRACATARSSPPPT